MHLWSSTCFQCNCIWKLWINLMLVNWKCEFLLPALFCFKKKKNYYPYLVSSRPNNTESLAICDDILTHTTITWSSSSLYISLNWFKRAAAAAKSLQSHLILCDPIDGSPQGFRDSDEQQLPNYTSDMNCLLCNIYRIKIHNILSQSLFLFCCTNGS